MGMGKLRAVVSFPISRVECILARLLLFVSSSDRPGRRRRLSLFRFWSQPEHAFALIDTETFTLSEMVVRLLRSAIGTFPSRGRTDRLWRIYRNWLDYGEIRASASCGCRRLGIMVVAVGRRGAQAVTNQLSNRQI